MQLPAMSSRHKGLSRREWLAITIPAMLATPNAARADPGLVSQIQGPAQDVIALTQKTRLPRRLSSQRVAKLHVM